jgi:RecB family exonuclease
MENSLSAPNRPIIAWSFSALNTFENCPRKFWATRVQKLVSDYNKDNTKGDDEHKCFDAYLKKATPLPASIAGFTPALQVVQRMPGQLYSEYSMALTQRLEPCKGTDWDVVWSRSIADVLVVDGSKATMIDWKFGKVPKEYKDQNPADQMEIAAAHVWRLFPAVNEVRTIYSYMYHNTNKPFDFQRAADEARIWNSLMPRVRSLEKAKALDLWPATPNPLCGWCPYGQCPHNTNEDAQR